MPVLESTDKIAPKSILRHRPIEGPTSRGKQPKSFVSDAAIPTPILRASRRLRQHAHEEAAPADRASHLADQSAELLSDGRALLRKIVRSRPGPGSRAVRPLPLNTSSPGRKPRRITSAFVFSIVLGMAGMVLLWMLFGLVSNWGTTLWDDAHYGRPRTYQTDVRVGHNHDQTGTPSHFIALNLQRRIQVIEFPGGDATHTRVFLVPLLEPPSTDLVPVTLTFVDVNNDKQLDMVVLFEQQRVVFLNDGQSFRLPLPSEQDQVAQSLRQLGLSH
ncbi:hypothetical protein [Dictyobacter arantiisoli]|uniref:VCBS repeat-containing protein n=1 Tax=Dictyobacter arantiisoli TaxID=2014874 RepID=A0A5A5T8A4_9CHLR|nr:hypothetical protein [Dictyobacter arantiisoli]GCF07587.1 hypothetical protein KDI_11510 [Dictyobacter arantiisoli]